MTIGDFKVGERFCLTAIAGANVFTVAQIIPGRCTLVRCTHWNERLKQADETSFAPHLEACPAPEVPPATNPVLPAVDPAPPGTGGVGA